MNNADRKEVGAVIDK